MKVVKLLAGGVAIVLTYNIGKLVGGFKVAKYVADGLDEVFPGFKKGAVKHASEKVIDCIFDKPEEEKESQ